MSSNVGEGLRLCGCIDLVYDVLSDYSNLYPRLLGPKKLLWWCCRALVSNGALLVADEAEPFQSFLMCRTGLMVVHFDLAGLCAEFDDTIASPALPSRGFTQRIHCLFVDV